MVGGGRMETEVRERTLSSISVLWGRRGSWKVKDGERDERLVVKMNRAFKL